MSQPLLLVEDEEKIARVLVDYLTAAGFTVVHLSSGAEVLAWVQAHAPALILLDLLLPGVSGLELCRRLRAASDVPLIVVTALAEERDRLEGLDAGADDYVCKPFSPREVVARVRVVLRRPRPVARGNKVHEKRAGPLALDEERRQISLDGKDLALTTSEYRLLRKLMLHPGRVFTRTELLDELHGETGAAFERAVDSHVKNLRRRLGGSAGLLRSVYGVGYRLDVEAPHPVQ